MSATLLLEWQHKSEEVSWNDAYLIAAEFLAIIDSTAALVPHITGRGQTMSVGLPDASVTMDARVITGLELRVISHDGAHPVYGVDGDSDSLATEKTPQHRCNKRPDEDDDRFGHRDEDDGEGNTKKCNPHHIADGVVHVAVDR